jgi:type IV pilus assembly protein PilV
MVSVIVICVGLLVIAKLQALSISNVTSSRLRALAAIQASSIASAMHSNRQYWFNTAPNTVTVVGTTVNSSDAALQVAAAAANAGTVCSSPTATASSGVACDAPHLAAFDLVRWTTALTTLLPNPAPNPIATITCPPAAGAPVNCKITISWTEQAVAINAQQNGTAAACTALTTGATPGDCFEVPTYVLYVEP